MESETDHEKSLRELAEESLVRSTDSLPDEREEIIKKIKDKILFVKETNKIEILYKTDNLQERIGLYLIAKFIGNNVLNLFDNPTASSSEISSNLNVSVKALAPSLGVLSKEFIEKEEEEYKIKAYKILDFLERLDNLSPQETAKKVKVKKKTNNTNPSESLKVKLILNKEGFRDLSSLLEIDESNLRRIFFVREDDIKIIDSKFLDNKSTKTIQLDASLAYLILYKHLFNLEEVPASLLRRKLQAMNLKSLSNLTSNLHRFPEFIIHNAGKKGSIHNDFMITNPGEERIKEILKKYFLKLEKEKHE